MRHKKKSLLEERIIFLEEDHATDPIDILHDAWDDLVFEQDIEERECFIELAQRLLKSYSRSDTLGLYSDDLSVN